MPTYHALGLTAKLSVTNLDASLSKVIDFRQGQEQRDDANRIFDVFSNGRDLPERPILQNGSEHGTLQFLGQREDIPFFMVEAGSGETDARSSQRLPKMTEAAHQETFESMTSNVTGVDPYLSSLRCEQILITPSEFFSNSSTPKNSDRAIEQLVPAIASNAAYSSPSSSTVPEALCLKIATSNKTFLTKSETGIRSAGKDLKFEVFVNGQLASVVFVNKRGSAIEFVDNEVRFHGTRIHRQIEKPWIYSQAARSNLETGMQRWAAVSVALKDEARTRGRNRWGDPPPTAEFLLALSEKEIPPHLKDKHGLGFIDVIITSGEGKKYGPEKGYVTAPTRMDDDDYSASNLPPDSFDDKSLFVGNDTELESPLHEFTANFDVLSAGLPGSPLNRRSSSTAPLETPTKKRKVLDLSSELKELGLDSLDDVAFYQPVLEYENARKKAGKTRTLKQRLSDIKQMNPENRLKSLATLREQLDQGLFDRRQTRDADIYIGKQSSVIMKEEPNVENKPARLRPLANAELAESNMIDPLLRTIHDDTSSAVYSGVIDPELVLDQERNGLALDVGAISSDYSFHSIVSTSPPPKPTPQKRTRASALSHSPCSVAIKDQQRHKSTLNTPQKRSHPNPVYNTPNQNDAGTACTPPTTSRRSVLGLNRTSYAWNPNEKMWKQVLQEFQVPELSKGSVVTYMDETKRQVGKARNGEFKEESVVVAMRFVVL
ncbi:hypothetical protein M433DRAFT_5921 [Acidomyces richmondensis BFW]|nr:MAG: hypothetical protein FE78DRAFT_466644 [Acidomyces sp. 'richmondensis']KYG43905.1 hypothetical protein M433DRAFT_5921 [Acidomyces richmondensis BFW]